ncbi:hypothetical protein GGR52DRAFT_415345 [Hypoxylon sp. FL1284]|nr:hypothetical protein GGR52DRAFT_415345 [Hypoxylon sp. FL1284]
MLINSSCIPSWLKHAEFTAARILAAIIFFFCRSACNGIDDLTQPAPKTNAALWTISSLITYLDYSSTDAC